jgi:hypothetical protein
MVPLPGLEPGYITLLLRELPLPIWPEGHYLVLPPGIEPGSPVLQTGAMTTSAKVAYIGVLDGERSHTIAFTEQCADHYTTNTIELGTRTRDRT